jgi:hypothetical protein
MRRWFWIILSPLIPSVRLAKQFVFLLINRPSLLGRYARSLPIQVIAHSTAAAGQAVGLLTGMGSAETAFLYYELNQKRRENSFNQSRLDN